MRKLYFNVSLVQLLKSNFSFLETVGFTLTSSFEEHRTYLYATCVIDEQMAIFRVIVTDNPKDDKSIKLEIKFTHDCHSYSFQFQRYLDWDTNDEGVYVFKLLPFGIKELKDCLFRMQKHIAHYLLRRSL